MDEINGNCWKRLKIDAISGARHRCGERGSGFRIRMISTTFQGDDYLENLTGIIMATSETRILLLRNKFVVLFLYSSCIVVVVVISKRISHENVRR